MDVFNIWLSYFNMIYLNIYTKNYNKAITYCDKILENEKKTKENSIFLNEIVKIQKNY